MTDLNRTKDQLALNRGWAACQKASCRPDETVPNPMLTHGRAGTCILRPDLASVDETSRASRLVINTSLPPDRLATALALAFVTALARERGLTDYDAGNESYTDEATACLADSLGFSCEGEGKKFRLTGAIADSAAAAILSACAVSFTWHVDAPKKEKKAARWKTVKCECDMFRIQVEASLAEAMRPVTCPLCGASLYFESPMGRQAVGISSGVLPSAVVAANASGPDLSGLLDELKGGMEM